MKNLPARLLLRCVFYFSITFSLFSCQEEGPAINLKGNENAVADTTYIESTVPAAEAKNVMLEEFTGVRCPNCPAGHITIDQIKTANPGRVVSISYHPMNSLGTPYPAPLSVED